MIKCASQLKLQCHINAQKHLYLVPVRLGLGRSASTRTTFQRRVLVNHLGKLLRRLGVCRLSSALLVAVTYSDSNEPPLPILKHCGADVLPVLQTWHADIQLCIQDNAENSLDAHDLVSEVQSLTYSVVRTHRPSVC